MLLGLLLQRQHLLTRSGRDPYTHSLSLCRGSGPLLAALFANDTVEGFSDVRPKWARWGMRQPRSLLFEKMCRMADALTLKMRDDKAAGGAFLHGT